MTITVRQADVGDVEALVALNRFVQDPHVVHQPDYFKQTDAMLVADWFRCSRIMHRNKSILARCATVPMVMYSCG